MEKEVVAKASVAGRESEPGSVCAGEIVSVEEVRGQVGGAWFYTQLQVVGRGVQGGLGGGVFRWHRGCWWEAACAGKDAFGYTKDPGGQVASVQAGCCAGGACVVPDNWWEEAPTAYSAGSQKALSGHTGGT